MAGGKRGKKRPLDTSNLGRSPVPPPGRFMDKDKYDRIEEEREAEREIEEGLKERKED
jgi:hypothetical protein